MEVTKATVMAEHKRIRSDNEVVSLIAVTRDRLGKAFDVEVRPVSHQEYRDEVDSVFADGDLAVNIAALSGLLRDLDVENDYPGFVVDELLGRELAGTIASTQGRAYSLLAEATFHYADVHTNADDNENAGVDDLTAALAAGFQTRLPGWSWTESESPFGV
jgi:hypothetical protein